MKSYKQAFDVLTMAYISGAVDPWNCKACFVGNLLDNTGTWAAATYDMSIQKGDHKTQSFNEYLNYILSLKYQAPESYEYIKNEGYTPDEIYALESNFLKVIVENLEYDSHFDGEGNDIYMAQVGIPKDTENMTGKRDDYNFYSRKDNPKYEDALFKAFESTLEMLKGIHQAKGEIIEETPAFVKRNLELV
jgi:hypothetical protein